MKLRILIGFDNISISAWIKENPCAERLRKKITVAELRRNKAAKSLNGIRVAAVKANIELLVLEQEWNIGPVAVGERNDDLLKGWTKMKLLNVRGGIENIQFIFNREPFV